MSSERVVRTAGPEPSLTVYPQRGKQVVLGVGAAVFVVLGVVLLLSGAGFVPWTEITGLGTWSSNGQTIVTVGVADPAAVLARVGPLARIPIRANVRLCGSPVTLPTNTLPFSADQPIREIAAFAPGAPRDPWGTG